MRFILTNFTTDEKQEVTRECVDRVKGKTFIDSLVKRVEQTGVAVGINFEGDYDLEVTNAKKYS